MEEIEFRDLLRLLPNGLLTLKPVNEEVFPYNSHQVNKTRRNLEDKSADTFEIPKGCHDARICNTLTLIIYMHICIFISWHSDINYYKSIALIYKLKSELHELKKTAALGCSSKKVLMTSYE